ncbi:hypothetical protein M0M57_08910 [Flavobacterium azooxidireducens]|uniref:Uncharacterized protein n=1 Tax=Flavobacterium azooxidireducens TaxID=1871076 RepID=A0ABY4KE30_9FLAO|nr:hypothetical protein [Flavobacterium azooxidireducens]UPQ77752.1 hypothetical protein M0M57_08910 [Flavobacterium azooxidireducens]
MEFYGSIDKFKFEKLSTEEKYNFLIEKNIFVKTKNPIQYEDQFRIFGYDLHEISRIFVNNYKTSKGVFSLNEKIIEVLKNKITEECNQHYERIINYEDLAIQKFYHYPEQEAIRIRDASKSNIVQKLSFQLFRDLMDVDLRDFGLHKNIIEKYIKYDHLFIYDYLMGLNNKSKYCSPTYYTFLHSKLNLSIYYTIYPDSEREIRITLPKKIGLLAKLGLFENHEFKKYLETEQHKLLTYIVGLPLTPANFDSIRRNMAIILKDTTDSGTKYTAYKHVETIVTQILKVPTKKK